MLMVGYSTSGTSHDFFAFNASGQVWNGSAFANWSDGSYTSYRIAATETGTSGRFTATAPSGTDRFALRIRAGTLATSTVVWEDTGLIDTALSTINSNAASAASNASSAASYASSAATYAQQSLLATQTSIVAQGSVVMLRSPYRSLNGFYVYRLDTSEIYNSNGAAFEAFDDTNFGNGYYLQGSYQADNLPTHAIDLSTMSLTSGGIYQVVAIDYSYTSMADTGAMRWDGTNLQTLGTATAAILAAIAGTLEEGTGDIIVDHNTGGEGNLRYTLAGGQGVEADVVAYLSSEYTADPTTAVRRGKTRTDSDGDWIKPMRLYASIYKFVFDAPGYELAVVEQEVA